MQTGSALVLPAGSVPRVTLSGDELTIKLLGYANWEAWVEYPDGYRRHHRALTVIELLDKIAGQLKMRYNLLEFSFKAIPQGLDQPSTITLGGIKYG